MHDELIAAAGILTLTSPVPALPVSFFLVEVSLEKVISESDPNLTLLPLVSMLEPLNSKVSDWRRTYYTISFVCLNTYWEYNSLSATLVMFLIKSTEPHMSSSSLRKSWPSDGWIAPPILVSPLSWVLSLIVAWISSRVEGQGIPELPLD